MPPVFISRYRPLRQVMGIPFEAGRGNARGPDQFCSGSVIRSGFQRIHLREMIGSLLSPSRGARCHFEAARGGLTFLELVPVTAGVPFSSRHSRPGFFGHSGQRRPQTLPPPLLPALLAAHAPPLAATHHLAVVEGVALSLLSPPSLSSSLPEPNR
jgi:hypothetical protein